MNVSLICLSLKYLTNKVRSSKLYRYLLKPHKLKTSYRSVSKVSKWFYHELVKYNYNDNKLRKALNKRNYKIIKSIIAFVQNKDILNEYLFEYYGNFDMLKLFIDNGADIQNNNILWLASKNGRYDIVKLLIDNGADVCMKNNKPLLYSIKNHHLKIAQLLIDNGADIYFNDDHFLIWASEYGHFSIVKFLIDNGVDANNDEALRLADKYEHFEVCKLLIKNGANKNIVKNNNIPDDNDILLQFLILGVL